MGSQLLPGGTSNVGGHDVGGVPVETAAGAVIAHRRARIGVRGRFLDITKRYPGVEGGGDERMPQGVRPDRLGHSGAAGYPAHDPPGTVPVQPTAISRQEDRSFGALADGQVDRPRGARCEQDGDNLAAHAGDDQGPVPALDARGLDVGADSFGHAQPVERQQRDQRVLGRLTESGGNEPRAQLVAV